MKNNVILLLLFCLSVSCTQKSGITIDASKKLHQASIRLNGTNMEDLNFQTYGGIYSQLLYGQDFEEHVDVDFLNLPTEVPDMRSTNKLSRYLTFVVLDEKGKPYLTTQTVYYKGNIGINPVGNPVTKPYELDSKRIPKSIVPLESLSKEEQKLLLEKVYGDKQISRYWKEVNSGNAKGVFKLINKGQYKGRRDQLMRFVSGKGEVGLDNMGLMRIGINLQEGKNYEGVLRVKNAKTCDIYVALLNSDGTKKLAEKAINLKASPNDYQKVEFDLTASGSDTKGRFAIILKEPCEVALGYAFLQPGLWGRVKGGYPIRQDFVDRLKENGMNIIRYNGSSNNGLVAIVADSMLYMWKNMIGPRDERFPFTGTFATYSTHSFGIFEFLMIAEAAGLDGVVGISKYEDPTGMKDMIEYAKGPVTSKWGAVRQQDGHPDAYNLKYIEISNEQSSTGSGAKAYFEKFKGLATEIWKADPDMNLLVSLNINATGTLSNLKIGDQSNQDYNQVRDFLLWIKEQGREGQFAWDSHYDGRVEPDSITYKKLGLYLKDFLAEDIGFKLRLFPLEENGQSHNFQRGMSHALLQNRLNRWGNRIEGAATANMFQPEVTYFRFNQGRVFYDSYRFWNQTSGLVDQMFTKEWLPWVLDVKDQTPTDSLDVLVKASDNGQVISLYVVNYSQGSLAKDVNLVGFQPKTETLVTQLGPYPFTARNSGENPNLITPKSEMMKIEGSNFNHMFPGHSFTVIRIERK
jgi:alpha-N-arabinofuranosidase